MTSLTAFAASMRQRANAVGVNSQQAVKQVAKAAGTTVVYATPIDTSRARMNWQSSVDSPVNGVLLPYPSQPASPSDGVRVALASLESAIGAYSSQRGGIWIVNNLDYIGALNDGWSTQAPADFVAQSVLAGVRSLATVRLLP